MTNSKSPLIHVKAIKTKHFQVDKHVTDDRSISCNSILSSVDYTSGFLAKCHKAKGAVKI